MKTYTFVIGTMDDFVSIEDLMSYVENPPASGVIKSNYSIYVFEAPKECDLSTVQCIGYGIAFENDWCQDGTLSFFIEGTLDSEDGPESSSTQMQMHDLWEIPDGIV